MPSQNIYTSPLCCCIVCKEIKSSKGIHTHFERSHGTKEQQEKYSNGFNGKYEEISKKLTKPKKHNQCLQCGKETTNPKFCGKSCSASYTNIRLPKGTKRGPAKGYTPSKQNKTTYTKVSRCVICGKWFPASTLTCSSDCKRIRLSNKSRENPNCGGKRNSHRSYTLDSYGTEVCLESSYEVLMANVLNELNVSWIRPSHLLYSDAQGKTRRYHPDFFLTEHDIYLDPKNDYLIIQDQYKIQKVQEENDVIIHIVSKKNLNKEWLLSILEAQGVEPS